MQISSLCAGQSYILFILGTNQQLSCRPSTHNLPNRDAKLRINLMVKVLTHLKPPRRFSMLFFDVLSFTRLASSVNGKTSKKSVQKTTRQCLVCLCLKGLYTPKNLHAFFFF